MPMVWQALATGGRTGQGNPQSADDERQVIHRPTERFGCRCRPHGPLTTIPPSCAFQLCRGQTLMESRVLRGLEQDVVGEGRRKRARTAKVDRRAIMIPLGGDQTDSAHTQHQQCAMLLLPEGAWAGGEDPSAILEGIFARAGQRGWEGVVTGLGGGPVRAAAGMEVQVRDWP